MEAITHNVTPVYQSAILAAQGAWEVANTGSQTTFTAWPLQSPPVEFYGTPPLYTPYVSWLLVHPEDVFGGGDASESSQVVNYNYSDPNNPYPRMLMQSVRIRDNITSSTDIQHFAAHELGHSYGLADCPLCVGSTSGTVMSYLADTPRPIGPTSCDVQQVRPLYP